MSDDPVMVNRAPVMTLWGAVVAARKGYDWDVALTLGKVLSGLNAQAKGRSLGIYGKKDEEEGEEPKETPEDQWIEICGRPLPAKETDDGLRALKGEEPQDPRKVQKYLHAKFGDDYDRVRDALMELAEAFSEDELNERAYSLYETFRPEIPKGKKGWGAKGELSLHKILSMKGLAGRSDDDSAD